MMQMQNLTSTLDNTSTVNQVETHIFNQQKTAKDYMDKYKVQIEA
jgi:diketogulonate reductase-like aldo/keto reductase